MAVLPLSDLQSMLSSRTVWSNIVGLGAIGLSAFGYHLDSGLAEPLAEAAFQTVAGISFIASTAFRIAATRRIALSLPHS